MNEEVRRTMVAYATEITTKSDQLRNLRSQTDRLARDSLDLARAAGTSIRLSGEIESSARILANMVLNQLR